MSYKINDRSRRCGFRQMTCVECDNADGLKNGNRHFSVCHLDHSTVSYVKHFDILLKHGDGKSENSESKNRGMFSGSNQLFIYFILSIDRLGRFN